MQASTKAPGLEALDMEGNQPVDQDGSQKEGTALDDHDMHRMGKVQELKVCLLASCAAPITNLTLSNREIYDLWLL